MYQGKLFIAILLLLAACEPPSSPPEDDAMVENPTPLPDCQEDFSIIKEGIFWEPENPEIYPEIEIVSAEEINQLKSWKDSPIFEDTIRMVLMLPGDYRLGEVIEIGKLSGKWNGSQPKIIRSYDPESKTPYYVAKERMATIEGVNMDGTEHTAWIDIRHSGNGVTKGNRTGGMGSKIFEANNNYFIRNHVENFLAIAGFRCMNSNGNVWYQCVIGPGIPTGQDYAGIGFGAYRGSSMSNNKIVDCHIYGVGDCIAFTRNVTKDYPKPSPKDQNGIAAGNVIAYNLLEVIKDQHTNNGTRSCSENHIDLKSGILTQDYGQYNLIYKNIMVGTRPTDQSCGGSGDAGASITIHRNAKGWLIEQNIVSDCAVGISCFFGNNNYPDELVENIEISNNIFHNIKNYLGDLSVTGMAMRLESDHVSAYDNVFISVDTTIVTTNPKFNPKVGCNRRQ